MANIYTVMEKYFEIRYEFNKEQVHNSIARQVEEKKPCYICVADGNILNMVSHNRKYRKVINDSIFSICDSSWVPVFVRSIYGYNYEQYCGSDIFIDIVRSRKYRMIFLGTKQETLNALQKNLAKENPDVMDMTFKELPFCDVNDFDYPAIAKSIEEDGADIIWIALGAPKQEYFMNMLTPHLKKGVCIAIGAAFNFFSGLATAPKRAPRWMVKWHMEFIHRIFLEPKKQIKRCWGIIVHLPRILWKEQRRKRKNQRKACSGDKK